MVPKTPKEALRLVEELKASPAWAYVSEVMRQEMLQAMQALTARPNMPLEELHYRRGAIWAAEQLLNILDRLGSNLKGEILISEKTKPAPLKGASAETPPLH